jgi:hypothetical protein
MIDRTIHCHLCVRDRDPSSAIQDPTSLPTTTNRKNNMAKCLALSFSCHILKVSSSCSNSGNHVTAKPTNWFSACVATRLTQDENSFVSLRSSIAAAVNMTTKCLFCSTATSLKQRPMARRLVQQYQCRSIADTNTWRLEQSTRKTISPKANQKYKSHSVWKNNRSA